MGNENSFAMEWEKIENTLREAVDFYTKNEMENTIEFTIKHLNNYKKLYDNLDSNYFIQLLNLIKDLQHKSETSDKFENIIQKMNLAIAYKLTNKLKPVKDFDIVIILELYNDALIIAKNELNSDFWEAVIKVNRAITPHYPISQSKGDLKQAKKIFEKLDYSEFAELINEEILEIDNEIKWWDTIYNRDDNPEQY